MSVSTTTHFSASIVFVLFIFVLLPVSSSQNLTQSVTPEKACNLTTNPSFCKSLIPSRARSNLYGYGRYLVNKSLRQSATFSSLIDGTIRSNASLSSQAAGALVDCLLLSQLTTDFLISSLATLESNDTTKLPDAQGDKVQTLLSAIVTNQLTCLDGLTQANFLKRKNALYVPLVNATKRYSVSLAMFTHSWVPKKKKTNTAGDTATKTRPGRELLETGLRS